MKLLFFMWIFISDLGKNEQRLKFGTKKLDFSSKSCDLDRNCPLSHIKIYCFFTNFFLWIFFKENKEIWSLFFFPPQNVLYAYKQYIRLRNGNFWSSINQNQTLNYNETLQTHLVSSWLFDSIKFHIKEPCKTNIYMRYVWFSLL